MLFKLADNILKANLVAGVITDFTKKKKKGDQMLREGSV